MHRTIQENSWMKRKVRVLLLLFVVFMWIRPDFAYADLNGYSVGECMENPEQCKDQTTPANTDNETGKKSESFSIGILDIIKMVTALLFVIGLLYFLLKFINKRSQTYQQNRLVQNIGGTALGGNRSIQIVKAGNRLLILGVGEDVRLLKEVTDEQEKQDLLSQYNKQLEGSIQPTDILSKGIESFKELAKTKKREDNHSFSSHFQSQLDAIKNRRQSELSNFQEKEHRKNE